MNRIRTAVQHGRIAVTAFSRTIRGRFIRWWAVALVILLAGGIVRFTGYNHQLPYVDLNDEAYLFVDAMVMRGIQGLQQNFPGYPPGILWVTELAQSVVEQTTHQSILDNEGYGVALVRFLSTAMGILTAIVIGLLARRLAGELAGWLAMAVWLSLPAPIEHSVLAMPIPWVMFFAVLATYLAVIGLESPWTGWPILSILAGLVVVLFKYSEFPALIPGMAVTLWHLWSKRQRAWGRALAVQIALIIGCAAWLLFGYQATAIITTSRPNEVKDFFGGNFVHLFDTSQLRSLASLALSQVGLAPWLFILIAAAGGIVYFRRRNTNRRLAWLLIAVPTLIDAWFVAGYVKLSSLAPRYMVSVTVGITLITVLSIVEFGRWMADQRGKHWPSTVAALAFAVVWACPMLIQSWQMSVERAKPDTRGALAVWAANTLEPGSVIVDEDNHKTLNKEYGGYQGNWRVSIVVDISQESINDWIGKYVYYAELSNSEKAAMESDQAQKQAYLDHMLLLKRFPPAGQIGQWQGPDMSFFRLWPIQHPLNAVFGGEIRLIGFDTSPATSSDANRQPLQPGSTLHLTLYWQPIRSPTDNYSVYLHLYSLDDRSILAQADGSPGPVKRPTITWKDPDETLISPDFQLTLPTNLAPGCYRVAAGLYSYLTGARLLSGPDDFTQVMVFCIGTAEF